MLLKTYKLKAFKSKTYNPGFSLFYILNVCAFPVLKNWLFPSAMWVLQIVQAWWQVPLHTKPPHQP